MDHRLLGCSGTSVSVQTLGTMTFGKESDEAAAHEILTAFVEGGGNLLDTADVYTRDRSEEIIGARTIEQLRDNMAAGELRLSEDELATLSEVSAPQMDDYPYGPAGIRQRHRGLVQGTN